MSAALTRIEAPKAAIICQQFSLSPAARSLLGEQAAPGEFLDRLLEAGELAAAIDFLAHGLPKREAVWWACLCVRDALGPAMAAPRLAALKAAVEWVLGPTEAHRRAAQRAGEAVGASDPAGCLALAAFWSEGSLLPENQPVLAPGPVMTARGASAAILLAAAQLPPEEITAAQRRFAELGREVARGGAHWPSSHAA